MAILSNGDILGRLRESPPLVECPDPKHPLKIKLQVQPASVDLRLSNEFFKYKENVKFVDALISQEHYIEHFELKENEPLILLPDEFIVGHTLENINLSNKLSARVEQRSSLARLGILTHLASYMNPGYRGTIPLQLKNISNKPIILRPYIRICTIIFEELSKSANKPYSERDDAKYKDERSAMPSKLSLDPDLFEKIMSKNELEMLIEKSMKSTLLSKDIDLEENVKEILFAIFSEAQFLAKFKGNNIPDIKDVEKASKNISKIYKYIFSKFK
ncbi:MAG: dCTP deaminase [Candidatus Helarchaeota archaeon]